MISRYRCKLGILVACIGANVVRRDLETPAEALGQSQQILSDASVRDCYPTPVEQISFAR